MTDRVLLTVRQALRLGTAAGLLALAFEVRYIWRYHYRP